MRGAVKGDERRWYYRLGPSCPSVRPSCPPVRPRPSRAHPHRVVQEFGGEVGAVGPDQRLKLGMNGELLEVLHVLEWLKNLPPKFVPEIHLTSGAIAEPQPDHIVPNVFGFKNIVVHSLTPGAQCARLAFPAGPVSSWPTVRLRDAAP